MSSILHDAVARGDVIGLRSALHGGAKPNELDVNGATPLVVAVKAGSLKLVQALKESGADPNIADADGRTPWQIAQLEAHHKIAQRLEEMGANQTHLVVDRKCKLCGEEVQPSEDKARCRGTMVSPAAVQSRKEPTGLGKVLDFTVPVILALVVFFGVQAWINAGASTIRVQLGAWRLLQISFITYVLYFSAIKPVVKFVAPGIWLR